MLCFSRVRSDDTPTYTAISAATPAQCNTHNKEPYIRVQNLIYNLGFVSVLERRLTWWG